MRKEHGNCCPHRAPSLRLTVQGTAKQAACHRPGHSCAAPQVPPEVTQGVRGQAGFSAALSPSLTFSVCTGEGKDVGVASEVSDRLQFELYLLAAFSASDSPTEAPKLTNGRLAGQGLSRAWHRHPRHTPPTARSPPAERGAGPPPRPCPAAACLLRGAGRPLVA